MIKISNLLKIALLSIFIVSLASCSSGISKRDDVVRIRKEYAEKYEKYDGPRGEHLRNGNALRGTVVNIVKIEGNDCETGAPINATYVSFLDSLAGPNENYLELIPIEYVDLVGPVTPGIPENEFGKINYFEYYSNPLNDKNIREVPVVNQPVECDPCNCGKVSVKVKGIPGPKIKCPDCENSWYFLELKAGYAIYSDVMYLNKPVGRDLWVGEIVAGYRHDNWGIGLAFNSGLKAYNQFDTTFEDINRSFLLLHGRYTFNPVKDGQDYEFAVLKPVYDFAAASCTRPFVYAQLGAAIDKLTMDLMKVKVCDECEANIDYEPANVDLSMPLSYAIGLGLEIPMPGCYFDLSFDLSYRNYSIGEKLETYEFLNHPSRRRLDIFMLRFGLTF
jgi:hypothetical protein